MTAGRKLRILLSAYACEPGKGSEPEVGWQWATGLARRGHEVWVLTRSNNRSSIEPAVAGLALSNLHFAYYDLPPWLVRAKRWIGVNAYYRLWQQGAVATARTLHQQVGFERALHVTFVVIRHPSLLRHLGIPYDLGPVSGGELCPPPLLAGLPLTFRLGEASRRWANAILMRSPAVRATLRSAQRIVTTTPETTRLVPAAWRHKVVEHLAITTPAHQAPQPRAAHAPLRALFVGRLLHWKGLHLGIRALAAAQRQGCAVQLTVVGDGPSRRWLADCARQEGIAEQISFERWRPRGELDGIYAAHDVLLFPSLRDSGGMVLLEAMQRGLPAVCLRVAGPGQIVDAASGIAVEAGAMDQVVQALADALCKLASSPQQYLQLAQGAVARAAQFSPDRLVASLGY